MCKIKLKPTDSRRAGQTSLSPPPLLRFSWQSFPLATAAGSEQWKFHIIHNWKIAVSQESALTLGHPRSSSSRMHQSATIATITMASNQDGAQQKANCNLTAFTRTKLWPLPNRTNYSGNPANPSKYQIRGAAALSNCFFAMNNLTFLTFDLEKNTKKTGTSLQLKFLWHWQDETQFLPRPEKFQGNLNAVKENCINV